MNKQRRAAIEAIQQDIEKFAAMRDDLRERIEAIRAEEEEYLDNMIESFRDGPKGEAAQAAMDALQNAHDDLENIDLGAITNSLEEAAA